MKLTIKQLALASSLIGLAGSDTVHAAPEAHAKVDEILITCFIKTDAEGHLSQFITELCNLIREHKAYFQAKYPHFNIDELLFDLDSIKNETSVLTIQSRLQKYWDLLPEQVRNFNMIKLAMNVRKRVRATT